MICCTFSQNADLAIADITITRQREHDVDFTSPFMNLGTYITYTYQGLEPNRNLPVLEPEHFDDFRTGT